jgi:alpha-1,2-mannosyltransferase
MIGRMRQDPPGTVTPAAATTRWLVLLGLALAGAVIVLIGWSAIVGAQQTAGWGYDFRAYLEAAQRLIATGSPYQTETVSGPFRPGPGGLYLYSPALALVLVPLTWLNPTTATIAWLMVRLGILVAACLLMPVPRWVRLATLGIALVSGQFLSDLNLGNVSLIVTFLAVVAWRSLDEPLSGLSIAASIALRPTMGVIWLWWIARRQWRAVAWTLGGLGGIFVASLPFIGADPWIQYVAVLRNLSDVMGVERNIDLGSTGLQLGLSDQASFALLLTGYVLAIGAILLSLRRDREIGFAVTLMATLLLSPLLWNHYLTNLIVPGALLAARGRRWGVLLPLLGWLPLVLLPFVTVAGMLLPFLAPDRGAAALRVRRDQPESIPDVDAGLSGAAGA